MNQEARQFFIQRSEFVERCQNEGHDPRRYLRDLDLMTHPDRWPMWPRLPLKRRDRQYDRPDSFGFLLTSIGSPVPIVYARLPDLDGDLVAMKRAIDACPRQVFDSLLSLAFVYTVD